MLVKIWEALFSSFWASHWVGQKARLGFPNNVLWKIQMNFLANPCVSQKVIVRIKSESEVTESCPTLCDPMDYSLPGSSVHGIFQAIVLGWIAISFCRGSSRPWDRIQLSRIVDRCFPVWANVLKVPGKW